MSFLRSRLLLATGLLGLAVSASAANLADVLAAASSSDPQWKAVRANLDARGEVLVQGRAGILPTLVLSGDKMSNDTENNVSGASSSYDSTRMALTLTQPLLRFDRWYQYQSARAGRSQVDAERVSAEQDFLVRVTETYLDVLRAAEQRSFARAEETALARQLEQAKQRFKVGLIAITDVHETQAAYDLAKVGLIVAQSQLSINRTKLATLTGQQYSALAFPGEDMPVLLPSPEGADAWAEKARQGNARLLAARHAMHSARNNARSATAGHLPTVDLVIQHSSQDSQQFTPAPVSVDTTNDAIGVQFNWPLFAGGAVNSQRKQANFQYDAAQENLRAAELAAVDGARTQYLIIEADVLRVAARKQAIVSAQSALDATQAGYEVGTRSIVDVLQAQRGAFAARRDLANARYDYILDLFRLHQAAGSLAEGNVKEGSQWLNVTLTLDDSTPVVDPNAAVKPAQ